MSKKGFKAKLEQLGQVQIDIEEEGIKKIRDA
jgi:hypothetical protein